MGDLSRPWPLGLGEKRWWQAVGGALIVLAVAVAFDRQFSLLAQSWPDYVKVPLAEITPYGGRALPQRRCCGSHCRADRRLCDAARLRLARLDVPPGRRRTGDHAADVIAEALPQPQAAR